MESYECPRCHNKDPKYIGIRNKKPYCRRCISFSLEQVCIQGTIDTSKANLYLDYSLSKEQEEVSSQVLDACLNNKNVLICAVTGAGKTELVYKTMKNFLKRGLRVGFATPRKDVVVDLTPRIKDAFRDLNVISVYGGHNDILYGDIIVLTSHQLCHYYQYFDLLIMDEIDAFPYANDFVLKSFFKDSVKGVYILLSATASEADKKEIEEDNGVTVYLNSRYTKKPLPVPVFKNPLLSVYISTLLQLIKFLKEKKKVFIFTSTIELSSKLYSFLSLFVKRGNFVSSQRETRSKIIEDFKKGEYDYLVTTTILERGVTFKDLQVIVFDADSRIFTAESLIQIAGRVGRKKESPEGEVIFYGKRRTEEIDRCISTIVSTNKKAGLS